jgi:hypothetical protein
VPAETALAHAGLIRQNRQRKIVAQMAVDPIMERAEFILCGLQRQGSAELRLSTGTFEENDQVAGDGKRHGTAEVLFHKRQGQIDPAVTPAEVQTRPSPTKNRIGLDTYGGKALRQPGTGLPMGCCATPVEYTRSSK